MRVIAATLVAVTVAGALACRSAPSAGTATPEPTRAPAPAAEPSHGAAATAAGAPGGQPGGPPGPGGRRPRPNPVALDSMRRNVVADLLRQIAGRENERAGSVFKNVKMFQDMPAADFLRMMNDTYGRSLGMGCTGCHVPQKFDSDEKQNKRLAREMQRMTDTINREQLSRMKDIDEDFPKATCAMCHRGEGHPQNVVTLGPPPAGAPAGPPPGGPPR